jgi:predicted nucleic acid-binding protein
MLNPETIVIDTSPLIALVAALGDLKVLEFLYSTVVVPFEVCQEIEQGGPNGFAVAEFQQALFLQKYHTQVNIPPFLSNLLDRGETAVIQLALNKSIQTVCIDEIPGRRVARLSGLSLTGAIGILIRAKREGYLFSMPKAIDKMKKKGIRLSDRVIKVALEQSEII